MTVSAAVLISALALASSAEPRLGSAPPVEAWAHEDWPHDALRELVGIKSLGIGLTTRSNMLRPAMAELLRSRERVTIELAPALTRAHVEQLRGLPRATLVFGLAQPLEPTFRAALERLGPQILRFRLARLDAELAQGFAGLKNFEVELDLRGRPATPDEERLLSRIERARRILRVAAADAPDKVAGLARLRPQRIIVESVENRVPAAMLSALHGLGVPVRVRVDGRVGVEDLRRLAGLPQLSLEVHLGATPDGAVQRLAALLEEVAARRDFQRSGESSLDTRSTD